MNNIFSLLPDATDNEQFEDLLHSEHVRIERIVSHGQSSPAEDWYDQAENEWVMVLRGAGTLLYEDGRRFKLKQGDYLNIPARTRHKVLETAAEEHTVWLAVFYK